MKVSRLKGYIERIWVFIKINHKIDYLIILILSLHVLLWFRNDYIFLTGDLTLPNISKVLYLWSDAVDGGYPFISSIWILWNGFFEIFKIIGLGLADTFKVYYLLTTFLLGASMHYFTSVITRYPEERLTCFLAALMYMFNPYLFTSFPFLLMYGALPLTIALYIRGMKDSGKKYAFYFSLTLPLLFIGFPNITFPLLTFAVLVLYTVFFFNELNLRHSFVFILTTLGFVTIVNLWWWLPSLYNMLVFSSPWKTLAEVYLPTFSFSLLSATRWLGCWAFEPSGYYKGKQYYPFINGYLFDPVMILVTFIPPLLAFSALLLKHKNKQVIFFAGLTAVSLFFAKGSNPPYGQLYESMLLSIPLSKFFRDTNRIMMITTLGYSFLIGTTCAAAFRRLCDGNREASINTRHLRKVQASIVMSACILLLLLNSWPLLTGDVIVNWYDPPHRGIRIPEFYYDADRWFNSQQEDFRILTLPRLSTYAAYKWGYQGPTIIPQIFSKPLITGTLWGGAYITAPSYEIVKSIDEMIYANDTSIGKVLGMLNVKYIVVDTSVDTDFYDLAPVDSDIIFLNSTIEIVPVRKFGDLLIYENEYFVPHIYSPSTITLLNGSTSSPSGIVWQDDSFQDGWVIESGSMSTNGSVAYFSLPSEGSYTFAAIGKNVSINPDDYPYLFIRFKSNAQSSIVVYVTTINSSAVYLHALNPPAIAAVNHYKSTDWYTLIYKTDEWATSRITSIHILITNVMDQTYVGPLELRLDSIMFAQFIGSTDDMIKLMKREDFPTHLAVMGLGQMTSEQQSMLASSMNKYIQGYRPKLNLEKISPSRYVVHVEADKPYFLVFSESYSQGWKAYVDGIEVKEHFIVNGYANAWFISSLGRYDLIMEFVPQRILDISAFTSLTSIILITVFLNHKWISRSIHSLKALTRKTKKSSKHLMHLRVLMYLPHPEPQGHIGGALFRTLEILKRAHRHGINYILIENKPSFKHAYGLECEGYEISVRGYPKSRAPYCKMIIEFILTGLRKCDDIDLILSPLESPLSVFPAYVTSKITGIPWTVVLQSVPGYWILSDELENYTSKFADIHTYLRRHKFFKNTTLAALSRWLMYKILKSTLVLSVSKSIAEDIQKVEKVKVAEIFPGNGIDIDRILGVPTRTEKVYDAMFAAAIVPEKGIFDALDAWALVVEKRPLSTLVIAGKGNKEMVSRVKAYINRIQIEKNIFFPHDLSKGTPTVEELWSLMKQSKILIHPSTVDAWPLVVGEAIACGLPVLTYDTRPTKYSYGNCPAIFSVPIGDIKALAIKALGLLENDSFKEYANQTTKFKQYSWDHVIEAEKEAYLKLLA